MRLNSKQEYIAAIHRSLTSNESNDVNRCTCGTTILFNVNTKKKILAIVANKKLVSRRNLSIEECAMWKNLRLLNS